MLAKSDSFRQKKLSKFLTNKFHIIPEGHWSKSALVSLYFQNAQARGAEAALPAKGRIQEEDSGVQEAEGEGEGAALKIGRSEEEIEIRRMDRRTGERALRGILSDCAILSMERLTWLHFNDIHEIKYGGKVA